MGIRGEPRIPPPGHGRAGGAIHRGFIAAGYGIGGVGLSFERPLILSGLLVGVPFAHPSFLPLFTEMPRVGLPGN